MEFKMAMQMNNSTKPPKSSVKTAVKNSIKPAYLIPLTAAVFFSSYSYAIGLQEIQIKSHLGEPLNATVMLTNPPASTLNSSCFTVLPKTSGSDFPGVSNATASVSKVSGGYAVNIRSTNVIKEPITSITLASNCSALPIIERTYTMMIDPAGVHQERVTQAIYTPRNNTRSVTALNSTNLQLNSRPAVRTNLSSIPQNNSYQIQRGDSLSSISARIQNTPENSMWSVAASIFATNPKAFVNNNPDYIIQGSTLAIPSFTAEFIPNEKAALTSIINGGSRITNSQLQSQIGVVASTQNNATANSYTPVQLSNEALSTMTLSTSLSAVSLDRIEARAKGQLISASLIPNTTSLFGSGEEKNPRSPLDIAATTPKQTVEPKVVYVDRPAYPSEVDQRINAGISEGIEKAKAESSSSFDKSMTSLLASLLGLGLLSWFVVRPFIKRRNRLAFIRSVRAHKKKSKYIKRNKQRKSALQRLPVKKSVLSTEIEEISNTFTTTVPDISNQKTESELQQHAAEIEAAFTGISPIITSIDIPDTSIDIPDSQAVVNKNNGPRDFNVAKEVYEVNTIDDTGELASLTMAFPELEAELNSRLGGAQPNLGNDLNTDIDANEKIAETLTVQFERPLEDNLDFELPGLEADFEAIVKDGEFSTTSRFNEDIFKESDTINPFDEDTNTFDTLSSETPVPEDSTRVSPVLNISDTLSTEALGSEDETRLSPVMIDDDGLMASDFGLDDDDFSATKEDYKYLEPDASINSPGLDISTQELEELGFVDDNESNNIVPFSKKEKSKKS